MISADELRAMGTPQDAFKLVGVVDTGRAGGLRDYAAQLRARPDDFELNLSVTSTSPRAELSHDIVVPQAIVLMAVQLRTEIGRLSGQTTVDPLQRIAQQVQYACAATLRCTVRHGLDPLIEVNATIWTDGLTRHALNSAVLEIAKARTLLMGLFREMSADGPVVGAVSSNPP